MKYFKNFRFIKAISLHNFTRLINVLVLNIEVFQIKSLKKKKIKKNKNK